MVFSPNWINLKKKGNRNYLTQAYIEIIFYSFTIFPKYNMWDSKVILLFYCECTSSTWSSNDNIILSALEKTFFSAKIAT